MSSAARRGLPKKTRMRHEAHFVEELVARNEAAIGKMVAIAAVEPDPNQPRVQMGELNDLVASIQSKGVLEPILVRRVSDGATPYRIISGERRYRAAMAAGLLEIPAIEMDVSEQEVVEIALIENLQRKDLTPFEEAEGYHALADAHDYTHEEIAKAVGKSRTVVTESLMLLQMPPKVRDAVEALGITTKSTLLEVLKLEDPEEMIQLLEQIARQGLSRDDLRLALRNRTREQKQKANVGAQKPYVFKFKSPDKRFNLNLTFRQSEVDHDDLIVALEEILGELKTLRDQT